MATRQTKKQTTTRKASSKPVQNVEGVDYIIEDGVVITCYDWGKQQTCKITLHNAFVIFTTIKESDEGYFLSYPSYRNNKGEYKNLAYCFDKDLIAEITETVTSFMNGD